MTLKTHLLCILCFLTYHQAISQNTDIQKGRLKLYYTIDFLSNSQKIGILDFNTRKTQELVMSNRSPRGEYAPALSKDGKLVVLNTYHYGGWKLAFTNPNGQNMRKSISNSNAYAYHANFSSDDKWIVYSGTVKSNYGSKEIFKARVTDGKRIRLTNGNHWNYKPKFSNNNQKICYTYFDYNSKQYEIYSMNSDGSNEINITNNTSQDFSASYSPDDSKIAFLSTRSGAVNLHVIDLKSKAVKQLTFFDTKYKKERDFNNLEWAYATSWSASGKIAFTVKEKGKFNIYTINDDGTGQSLLIRSKSSVNDPKWNY